MAIYFQNSFRFFLALFVQLLIINWVDFGSASSYMYPLFYVIFIVLLPLSIPHPLLILLAFLQGITIDIFMSTGGLHASSLVTLALLRPYILRFIAPREDFDVNRPINSKYIGFRRFVTYLSLCILIQHFWFFSVEFFKITELHIILWKTIANGFFTLLLILVYDFISQK
ncbi:MAG: hypothetical protein ACLGGV_06115 [Bacteroidia bacterium]